MWLRWLILALVVAGMLIALLDVCKICPAQWRS